MFRILESEFSLYGSKIGVIHLLMYFQWIQWGRYWFDLGPTSRPLTPFRLQGSKIRNSIWNILVDFQVTLKNGVNGLRATSGSSLNAKQRLYRPFFYLMSALGENQKISLTVKFHLGLTPAELLTPYIAMSLDVKFSALSESEVKNSDSHLNFPSWPSNDLDDHGQGQF